MSVSIAGILIRSQAWGADLPPIAIQIDARELPRRLVHTTLDIRCQPGPLRLWYPKWIPVSHAAKSRVDGVGGLRHETLDGTSIPWKRDEIEMHGFTVRFPDRVKSIRVKLDTICEFSGSDAAGDLYVWKCIHRNDKRIRISHSGCMHRRWWPIWC